MKETSISKVRQIEDAYSDPDIIAAQHRAGRSAFFEVQLVLAELDERIASAGSGGLLGSPTFVEVQSQGGIGEGGGGGGDLILD